MSAGAVRVLVVDDSAFARKVIREVLDAQEGIEVVGIARDGLDALEKISVLSPDVVTLDLVMPNLDGLGVLRALATLPNRPEVVIVSMTDMDSELGVAALQLGAFEVVTKPTALATDRLYELRDDLCAKVVAAGHRSGAGVSQAERPHRLQRISTASNTRLLLIGASTGGPQAITLLLHTFSEDLPVPVAVVVHMPEGYTQAFARRVNVDARLEVLEAEQGMALKPGRAIVARAGVHLGFRAGPDGWFCALDVLPLGTPHKPAVDVMFRSGAELAKEGTLGVVLTGMGNDGLAGSRVVREAGGRILTEAASSCVVYGMPRCVAEAGLSNGTAPLGSMAELILQHL